MQNIKYHKFNSKKLSEFSICSLGWGEPGSDDESLAGNAVVRLQTGLGTG